jgi:hypothetical protein
VRPFPLNHKPVIRPQRAPRDAQDDRRRAQSNYRCTGCRNLFVGPPARHGDWHECGSGRLELVARVTKRMLDEAESYRILGVRETG